MNTACFYKRMILLSTLLFFWFILGPNRILFAAAQSTYDPTTQTPTLLYNEARTVYLGNLARHDNGVPPLRWNRQLTYAARWFSWDSTENRPNGFCGHQDTQGNWPGDRALTFGYLGSAGAENAYCGYLSPEDAIQGWMNSPGHRANLLDPNSREIGLGYYRRNSDGRGYVTQDFGSDVVYAPVIIENEAISALNPSVNLYIYDRSTGGGFSGLSRAAQMMVSNNLHFSGATWEPYNANKAWTLVSGSGWRNVYVKTRDTFNRTLTVSDDIYLGAEGNVPLNEIGTGAQMSTTQSQVTLYNLNGGALPQVQFSLGWLADDTDESFHKWWGNGVPVNDAAAWGGTAYRLYPGDGESFAWVNDWKFPIKDTKLVAYFRLKVNDNTSSSEVARISVKGGGIEYGPVVLKGTDFTAPNQYQEFALNFIDNTNPNDVFLTFQFWRSGSADLYVDAVSIFSAPQPIASPLTWSVPGNNYRGQGVWVRYTNGSQFSNISDGVTVPYTISGSVGVGGVTLSYTDGNPKTVLADASGNYVITVPYGWTGSVTPSHVCYIFQPGSLSYDNVTVDLSNQDYTATFNAASGCANVNVKLQGLLKGNYIIPPGGKVTAQYSELNGPVDVVSLNALQVFTSERVHNGNGFVNELMGLPNNQLTNEYWFPWYDNVSMASWILIGNPSSSSDARVHVYVGGVEQPDSPYSVPHGSRITQRYPGVMNGPVHIVSDINVLASERVHTGQGFVNEALGIPDNQLTNEYWFPWYDNVSMASWILVGNPSTDTDAHVHIYIAGVEQSDSPYTITPGSKITPRYTGVLNGPVHIKSDINVFTSERVHNANGFINEVMGVPNNKLFTEYWFPWYDNVSMASWILVGNPSTTKNAQVHIYIAGVEQPNSPFTIGPGGKVTPRYTSVVNGPVHIVSDINVFTSERVHTTTQGFVNEMPGIPNNQLTTEYWFPWYDNQSMRSWILIGKP